MKWQERRGFTLIELVIVIAILGILAGIAIPRIMDATAAARGARIVSDLRTIDSAVALYHAKTGEFSPVSLYGSGSDYYTTDDPANGKYLLLEEWPKAPKNVDVIFPSAPNKKIHIGNEFSNYGVGGTDAVDWLQGRACFAAIPSEGDFVMATADQLAEGGSWGN